MGEERKVGENFDADKASDIFDKIRETELGFNDEVQLTDAISKLDDI